MLINIEATGIDKTLGAIEYTETRRCDNCKKEYSFSYTACWDLQTATNQAKERNHGNRYGDNCVVCLEIKEFCFSQPSLF